MSARSRISCPLVNQQGYFYDADRICLARGCHQKIVVAMLLRTALVEISVNTKNDTAEKRKPLSDIGMPWHVLAYFFSALIFLAKF